MRVILHSDLNNFYASCECLVKRELKDKPVVVCGSVADRHGIVLAKNMLAKKFGIKTGDTIIEAKHKCPKVIPVEANFETYKKYSRIVKSIYSRYTNRIESFGIDEAWLDVTNLLTRYKSGYDIAEEIRKVIKRETGLTVSIGVSYNKVFAKLGSDLKKPDAVSVITKENYKKIVWPLKVEELLFVGRSTKCKFNDIGIYTIGDLAKSNYYFLKDRFGKWGEYLYLYANGLDSSPVINIDSSFEVKSIGNSMTFYRDLKNIDDVSSLIYMLSETVSSRMKDSGKNFASIVRLYVIDENLNSFVKQERFGQPVNLSKDIAEGAIKIFKDNYDWKLAVRGVGVSVSDFRENKQLNLFAYDNDDKSYITENAIEEVRSRYGRICLNRAMMFKEDRLSGINIKDCHTVHPIGFRG